MSYPFKKFENDLLLVEPRKYGRVHYGLDLTAYWRSPNNKPEYIYVEFDPETLVECHDKAVFDDKIVKMYKAKKLIRLEEKLEE